MLTNAFWNHINCLERKNTNKRIAIFWRYFNDECFLKKRYQLLLSFQNHISNNCYLLKIALSKVIFLCVFVLTHQFLLSSTLPECCQQTLIIFRMSKLVYIKKCTHQSCFLTTSSRPAFNILMIRCDTALYIIQTSYVTYDKQDIYIKPHKPRVVSRLNSVLLYHVYAGMEQDLGSSTFWIKP